MSERINRFQVDTEILQENPEITLLALSGRFDADGLPPVLTEIEDARANQCSRFLVDLRDVSFIGSAGIGIFLSLVEEMTIEGGGVVFTGVPEPIVKIFDILNVLEFLEIRESREKALNSLLSKESASRS